MKCPQCEQAGQTSKLYSNGSTKHLLGWSPYYDENASITAMTLQARAQREMVAALLSEEVWTVGVSVHLEDAG